jgi:co-chaperonin GroES (HSP10)
MITTIKKIKPLFNMIVTTCNKYDSNKKLAGTSLLDASKANTVKEYQTVVATGPSVRGIEVGDTVYINPTRYAVKKHQEGSLKDGVITDNPTIGYNFNLVNIDGENHLLLYDSDIMYVAEIEEFDEQPAIIVEETPTLIV